MAQWKIGLGPTSEDKCSKVQRIANASRTFKKFLTWGFSLYRDLNALHAKNKPTIWHPAKRTKAVLAYRSKCYFLFFAFPKACIWISPDLGTFLGKQKKTNKQTKQKQTEYSGLVKNYKTNPWRNGWKRLICFDRGGKIKGRYNNDFPIFEKLSWFYNNKKGTLNWSMPEIYCV